LNWKLENKGFAEQESFVRQAPSSLSVTDLHASSFLKLPYSTLPEVNERTSGQAGALASSRVHGQPGQIPSVMPTGVRG